MAAHSELVRALHVLQYLSPILTIAYFLLSYLVSVIRLQTLETSVSGRLRYAVCVALTCFTFAYLAQAGMIIDLIFVKPGIYGSDPTNIHALSSFLVWLSISTALLTVDFCTWSPFVGSWLLALAFEAAILALTLAVRPPQSGAEISILSVQGAQIALLILVSVVFLAWPKNRAEEKAEDEERAPLLQSDGTPAQADGTGPESAPAVGNGKTKAKTQADDDDSDDEEDESWWQRKQREGKEQLDSSLKEKGGWIAYVQEYTVFLPYVWPAQSPRLKLNVFGVLLCIVAQRILTPLVPIQLGILVETLGSGTTHDAFKALGVWILLKFLSSNIEQFRSWLWQPVHVDTQSRLEKAMYDRVMELSMDWHESMRQGDVFGAMSQGSSVSDILETIGFNIVPQLSDLIIAFGYLHRLFGPYMMLIAFANGIFYLATVGWLAKLGGIKRRAWLKAYRRRMRFRSDTVQGWRTVSYFNRVPYSESKYAAKTDKLYGIVLLMNAFWALADTLKRTINDLGLFSACALGVYQIMLLHYPVGRFVTLITYWPSVMGPINSLSSSAKGIFYNLVDAEALLKIWKQVPSVQDGAGELALQDGNRGCVTFDDVCFKYSAKKKQQDKAKDTKDQGEQPKARPGTIESFSFEAKPGETIALVGETGAGKSTILKLLFRLYDVTGGSIRIDGQDVRSVSLASLRSHIGVVPQDPSMFHTSIMENLRYARLDATDEEIHNACRAAAIHDKILTFEKGYATQVGDRGLKLSGGELQRVAIARAILKNPDIVLLDEATSAVDSETEAHIQEGLQRLCQGKTTFVVAHRLSTIQHADQILVIKDGKIAERGSASELLEQKGKYYSLWTKQVGLFDPFAKSKKGGLDSDQTTVGGNSGEGEVGIVNEDSNAKADAGKDEDAKADAGKSKDAKADAEKNGNAKNGNGTSSKVHDTKDGGEEQQTHGPKRLGLTKQTALPAETSSARTTSPTKPAFRPEAPEFVPRSRRSESRSEDTAIKSDSDKPQQSSRKNRRGQSQSEGLPSRPGSAANEGPGLLALQRASHQSSQSSQDSKR